MTKLAENNPQGTVNIADDRVLACRYCILGFEYNEPMKHAEFFKCVNKNEILKLLKGE